jgi:hypothetical protein
MQASARPAPPQPGAPPTPPPLPPPPPQVPELDAIVVPVSGGGMISGIALAAKALKPGIVVVAAEPAGSNDAADIAAAKAAGRIVPCDKPRTIADGLQGADQCGCSCWRPRLVQLTGLPARPHARLLASAHPTVALPVH